MDMPKSRTMRVYDHLLRELRSGMRRPGAAISVKDAARRFGVSPTPVREALERLTGEGMVSPSSDRNGFVVPRIGLRGFVSITEAFTIVIEASLGQIELASDTINPCRMIDPTDPVGTTETIFDGVLLSCTNPVLVTMGQRLSNMLAPYRLVEPLVIEDWSGEMLKLATGISGRAASRSAIRTYVRKRRSSAAEIVDRTELGPFSATI